MKHEKRLQALEAARQLDDNHPMEPSPSHLAILRFMRLEYQEEHGQPMSPAQEQEALNRMREQDRAIELDRLEGETPTQHALRRFAEANSEGL